MTIARRGFVALGAAGVATGLGLRPGFAADKTVVLGCSIPLSGPAAPTGISTQRAVEHAFPAATFVTFNGGEMRELFPDTMGIFYMYSVRRGVAVKPWFIEEAKAVDEVLANLPKIPHASAL